MDIATQSMYALIEVVKTTDAVTREEALEVLRLYYPSAECEFRLGIYISAMFSVGSIDQETWSRLCLFMYEASMETLARIMGTVRVVADLLFKAQEDASKLLVRKAELEAIVVMGDPAKITPDDESMEFWNMMAPEVMEYQMAVQELEVLNERL